MADKRVTFEFDGMRLLGADGKVMWEHMGQIWRDLPQAGAVFIQSLLVELEGKLVAMGEVVAEGGTPKEQIAKAVAKVGTSEEQIAKAVPKVIGKEKN